MSKTFLVSLENLGAGAAVERFDYELQRVLDNIADLNTEAKATREVTLKIKVKPSDNREHGQVEIIATSKLAAIKAVSTTIFMANEMGNNVATEYNPKQEKLQFESEFKQKVTD